MTDYNPDNVGNLLEVYGYEGWPDMQDYDLADAPCEVDSDE